MGEKIKGELDWRDMWHVWERRETRAGSCWENLKETDHLEDRDIDRIKLKHLGGRGLDRSGSE